MNTRWSVFAILIWSTLLQAGDPEAPNRDWPCEQVMVQEVVAAQVWAGPPLEEVEGDWRDFPEIRKLVERVVSPLHDPEQAQNEIEAFAAGLQPSRKERMLVLLFKGILETLNRDRSKMIHGILRYSRSQDERARYLGGRLDEMVRLEAEGDAESAKKLASLKEQMALEQRIFDEREDALRHLCTRPVAIEQRLGFLARTITAQLD